MVPLRMILHERSQTEVGEERHAVRRYRWSSGDRCQGKDKGRPSRARGRAQLAREECDGNVDHEDDVDGVGKSECRAAISDECDLEGHRERRPEDEHGDDELRGGGNVCKAWKRLKNGRWRVRSSICSLLGQPICARRASHPFTLVCGRAVGGARACVRARGRAHSRARELICARTFTHYTHSPKTCESASERAYTVASGVSRVSCVVRASLSCACERRGERVHARERASDRVYAATGGNEAKRGKRARLPALPFARKRVDHAAARSCKVVAAARVARLFTANTGAKGLD
eukprot:5649404-Pleurochrysis_carterae.AAC.2